LKLANEALEIGEMLGIKVIDKGKIEYEKPLRIIIK